jgi:hypothetical protein
MIYPDGGLLRKICSGEINQKSEKWLSQSLLKEIERCGSQKSVK